MIQSQGYVVRTAARPKRYLAGFGWTRLKALARRFETFEAAAQAADRRSAALIVETLTP